VLARDGHEGLCVLPSLDQPALDAGGNALLSEIDRLLAGLAPYSEERDALSTALLGTSEVLKIDAEGRVILTESLKSFANITDTVTVVGHGHKFQIWEPETFRAHLESARARARDLRRRLGEARADGAGAPT
jgi:MraZ protein